MNEFGKICTEVNTRIVQDTVWFPYYRITDDDPFGIDNHVNEFCRTHRKGKWKEVQVPRPHEPQHP